MNTARTCSLAACDAKHFAKGLCRKHYTPSYEYKTWIRIKTRCYYTKHHNYKDYGGRGIRVYDGWLNNFQAFHEHIGDRPGDGYSIDRIDCDGDYEPGNVRWATQHEQAANKRTSNRVVGVCQNRRSGLWQATLNVNKQRVFSKSFKRFKDAVTARKEAEIQYGIFI